MATIGTNEVIPTHRLDFSFHSIDYFQFFREYVDSNTVFGFYLLSFFLVGGNVMYAILCVASIGFFISLTIYLDAISEDFKTTISEMNDEVSFENKKISKSRPRNNDSSIKFKQAILIHYDMLKYFDQFYLELELY